MEFSRLGEEVPRCGTSRKGGLVSDSDRQKPKFTLTALKEYLEELLADLSRRLISLRGALAPFLQPTSSNRLASKDESRRAHAGIVVNLFAAIMARIDGITIDDMDSAMDILRYDFPNVEHSWLAERFQTAYTNRYPLEPTLVLAAAKRTEAERVALALEILTMLHRVGGNLTNPTLLERVTSGLGLPGAAQVLERLCGDPNDDGMPPIEVLRFSETLKADGVTLSDKDKGVQFRILRCANAMFIINDAHRIIKISGQIMHRGDMLPFSHGQCVDLASGPLSYASIAAQMQSRSTGVSLVGYMHVEGDSVTVSRQRTLNCDARVRFGVHVEIEILRKGAEFYLDGIGMRQGDIVCTTYYTPFSLHGLGPYRFADLHNTEEPGRSFQLNPATRKITVTNLPYINRPGALLLTPGLSPSVVFEVSYSRDTNEGMLHIIEGTSHALSVQGVPVRGDTSLRDGDLIGLSDQQFLRCRFSAGVLDEESSLISKLSVKGLTRDFVRAGRVVDNIDFVLRRGEMACILGPSGSGKSTLLSMLAGHLEPSFGTILYNRERLTQDSLNLRRHIAFIPREDILDEAMTVGEHVVQASVARRPRLHHADRMRRVLAVLNFVGLGHLSKRHVGRAGERTISDGERTRLNLGLDLTGTAEVFLIDEPISGLASGDAERVIQTLEDMSSSRILLCTLHRPAQSILGRFKKVMVLNAHGQMAFWGSPEEMVAYFKRAAAEMGLHIPREALAAGGADLVFEILEAPYNRLGNMSIPAPDMWQKRFENSRHRGLKKETKEEEERDIPPMPARSLTELWKLFVLWVTRTFLGRLRSRMGLYTMLLEGPVLALLIAGTLRAATDVPYTYYKSLHINEYLFLSLVLAMFFGLTDSACEILKDRPLIRRESNYKMFITGYLLAKSLVLTGIAALQCALYLWVGNAILCIEEMYWLHFGVMVLTSFVGIALSLMVSAVVRSERTALNIVPLLLVPQILLAGALVRFEEMNDYSPNIPDIFPAAIDKRLTNLRHRVAYQDEETHEIRTKPVPLVAEFCPLRYAFEMIFVEQSTYNLWEIENSRINKRRDFLKEHGDEDELRFIQRAALLLNTTAKDALEAKRLLRSVRKAALSHNEENLENIMRTLDNRDVSPDEQPLEFFFSNRRIATIQQGVKTARKDGRIDERRGFYLSPRQARPFSAGIDQETDAGSISTLWRNAVYLFLMGLFPILYAGHRLKRICRGS